MKIQSGKSARILECMYLRIVETSHDDPDVFCHAKNESQNHRQGKIL